MSHKFPEYDNLQLSGVNKKVLDQWQEEDLFARTLALREGAPSFVFYEGPPSANGMPGIHHVMARSIKDIFCRYKTMKGFRVDRKAGWDTHGLPVELGVEKALGITKEDIGKKISVDEYNAACRREVMKYTQEWEQLTRLMGYWVDMDHPYITYDNRYIETLWYLLSEIYKKGLLYKGYTIQPYSPAAGTGLSTHELNQPGCYRDVKDTTCVAQFRIIDPRAELTGHGEAVFLAWTTTPWTLPSNTALCVGPEIDYVAVRSFNPYSGAPITAVVARALLHTLFSKEHEGEEALAAYQPGDKKLPYVIVGEWKGKDLVGMRYEQLLPWMRPDGDAFRVIAGDFVTTSDGTGIVHIAPTFGADDNKVAKASDIAGLTVLDRDGNVRPMVDMQGRLFRLEDMDPAFVKDFVNVDIYKEFAGRYVKNAYDDTLTDQDETLDVTIALLLKGEGRAFKIEKHVHSYPHCWRTDKPVLYYPLDSWFIRTTACREEMMRLNDTINWKPESTGTGRFGKWLENLQDWNLSRSRYWGTPLPIWRTEDGREEICISSVEELYHAIERSVEAGFMTANPWKDFTPGVYTQENYDKIDLHRPYVDDIILVSPSGKPMRRETDLIDVWFDSGAMPFAQLHYPFENKELLDSGRAFPADFIAEGVDQTRGWFFTLHAIATMVRGTNSYKAVISNGLVLDKNGNKMSKRLGNAVDPFETIEKYGSDPLRWYMISNSSPWDNLKFDPEGVDECRRKFFGTLYNTYSFFALYANVDNYEIPAEGTPVLTEDATEIDRWIISKLNSLVDKVTAELENFDPTRAGRLIDNFVNDDLSNWYVRLNRKRFWGKEMSGNKRSAYDALYTCLMTVAKLVAPLAPFYADELYHDLGGKLESVHLDHFPVADEQAIDADLEIRMGMAQKITSMTLALRRKVNIKVRQPLAQIMIPAIDAEQRQHIEAVADLIKNEVNVKELLFVEGQGMLVKKIKCNFRVMGKKFGKLMKSVAAHMDALTQDEIALLETSGSISFEVEGQAVTVEACDVDIISEDIPGWLVSNEGNLTVALEVELTEELKREGMARELINRIQNLRKETGLEITDRILVTTAPNVQTDAAIESFGEMIKSQVLANDIKIADNQGAEVEFDDFKLNILVEKD